MKKRIVIGIVAGALLGVVCIIGASLRSTEEIPTYYLFAFWYNRVIIGLVIGLLPKQGLKKLMIKGIILGAVVSFAFFSSTNYQDLMGFIAGIVYGAIISFAIYYFNNTRKTKSSQ